MTKVVNIQHDRCEVYIGRGGPFGNPYVIGENGDRGEVLFLFEDYFYGRLKRDPEWKAKVEALRGKVLGCFCAGKGVILTATKPWRCHGQIIAGYLDNIPREQVQ